jgi:hypothetical protein
MTWTARMKCSQFDFFSNKHWTIQLLLEDVQTLVIQLDADSRFCVGISYHLFKITSLEGRMESALFKGSSHE